MRIAAEILPKEKSHILLILDDFFNIMKNPGSKNIFFFFKKSVKILKKINLEIHKYHPKNILEIFIHF
jgi:hypothetical protein